MKTGILMKVLTGLLKGDRERALLQVIDYLMAEVRVLKEDRETIGRRLLLTAEQRRELTLHGKAVIEHGFRHTIQLFTPDTLIRWYLRLCAEKYDSSRAPRKPGRPEIPPHVSKLILQMARENRSWGYDRIVGALSNLGHTVCDQTVANVLKRHGLEPAPERDSQGTWKEFLERHLAVLWATDFFTTEVLTMKGLVTYYAVFFIHLETRRVVLGGLTPQPTGEWTEQIARNVTAYDGELAGARYLIRDRDGKFTQKFDEIFKGAGIETIKLPPRSPDLNAYAERFVLSVKDECLRRFIPLGESFLRHVLREYLAHYHAERNHQGTNIGNRLLFPDERGRPLRQGKVVKHERLGGLLNFYQRATDQAA
jgi:putative transposase